MPDERTNSNIIWFNSALRGNQKQEGLLDMIMVGQWYRYHALVCLLLFTYYKKVDWQWLQGAEGPRRPSRRPTVAFRRLDQSVIDKIKLKQREDDSEAFDSDADSDAGSTEMNERDDEELEKLPEALRAKISRMKHRYKKNTKKTFRSDAVFVVDKDVMLRAPGLKGLLSVTVWSFISNTDHVTLGDGAYNNICGNLNNIVNYHIYGRKRHGEKNTNVPELSSTEPLPKCRRHAGIKVIRNKYLKLKLEIGSGPGYLLHAGEAKGRAVIVKVFDGGPTQLESTVALSKGLMHPNVLRIEGVSSSASLSRFIAYENGRHTPPYWKTAEGPLAAAFKDDLAKSVALGLTMVCTCTSSTFLP
ncbi:hypothetical protein DFH09DRAFT_1132522 [Mycena vulgaris]|nr:hypothetical protein DFH09DRAFT_1132522 [Mycena vulgaris]